MKEAPLMVNIDTVRFDKRLTPMARLFYAEVCGNVTVNSGCPVNDDYFAKLYDCSARQVRTWRAELKELGYTKEVSDSLGFKYILPSKFNYEEQINTIQVSKEFEVTYYAPDGRAMSSVDDVLKYFYPLIENSQLPQTFQPNTRKFFTAFANTFFNIDYYNKKFTGTRFETTKEFYQYVIQVINPIDIYQKAEDIFLDKYSGIKQITYYVIAVIVNLYKDEFMSKARRKYLALSRKSQREKELEQKQIEEKEKQRSYKRGYT